MLEAPGDNARVQPSLWLAGPSAAARFDPARQSFEDRRRWSRMSGAAPRLDWTVSRALLAHVGRNETARSLSHAGGYAALALAPPGTRVGVDVEVADPRRDCVRLSRFAFAPAEADAVAALEGAPRRAHFYSLWTLKEACIKAFGLTLLEGLRRCVFTLEKDRWQAAVPAAIEWDGWLFQPAPELYLAVVCQPPAGGWRQMEWPEPPTGAWPLLARVRQSSMTASQTERQTR